jgi:DNA-binding CsgD family transcriptional regulator
MPTDYSAPGPNRERVRALLATGMTPREIGKALDISRQRVYAIKRILDAQDADKAKQEAAS